MLRNAAEALNRNVRNRTSQLRDWQRKAPDRLILQKFFLNRISKLARAPEESSNRRRTPHHRLAERLAVAGDYMSAASFGIAGLIACYGYDGFMYSVGWLVAYLTVLLIVAEPLRNAGKYTTFLGIGAATLVGRDHIAGNGGINMSAPLLAQALGGDVFLAFISAVAFATIFAVVAGLTISASTSFAHDFWTAVVHRGVERSRDEEVHVARAAAFVVGLVSILIAIALGPGANVAFLVGLAFAVAASANLPVIILSLYWKRFNTAGAVAGLAGGLIASIGLILLGPAFRA